MYFDDFKIGMSVETEPVTIEKEKMIAFAKDYDNWSHRTVRALKKIFEDKGIPVESEHFFAHMLRISARIEAAKEFGKMYSGN